MLFFILIGLSALSHAEHPFFEDEQRGWFWGEVFPLDEDVEPELEPEPSASIPAEPAEPAGPPPLSTAWLREEMPKALDSAIDNPTAENIEYYLYLQKVSMNKSEEYAKAVQLATIQDPVLNENYRRPSAGFASRESDSLAAEQAKIILSDLSKDTQIWFFFASNCPYCHKMLPVLDVLKHKYNLKTFAVSMDKKNIPDAPWGKTFKVDQGQAAQLGVKTTPSVFLVRAKPEPQFLKISSGIISATEFERRALLLAHQANWISDEQLERAKPVKSIPNTPDLSTAIATVDSNDKALFINELKSAMNGDR